MRLAPCVLLIVWTLALHAAAPPTPCVDLDGDPLPPGAVARLGSARLRHTDLSDFVFTRDGKTALTAGSDHLLRWWDLASGRQTKVVRLAERPRYMATLSPDGKTLAALDGTILVLWDAATGKVLKRLPADKGRATYLFFSPDGATLAAGLGDNRVAVWDWRAGTQRELTLPERPAGAVDGAERTTHATFSPDGKWFIAGGDWHGPLIVFDLATGREVHRLRCHPSISAVSPDSKTLLVSSRLNDKGDNETVIRLFDLKTGKPLKAYPQGSAAADSSLAVSPDGTTLARGGSGRSCLLDLATGRVLHRLTGAPYGLAFAPGGKTLAGVEGTRLRVWDPLTGKERHDRPGDFSGFDALAASPDGRLLAYAERISGSVLVWETASGRLMRHMPLGGETDPIHTLTFAPDGRTLFAFLSRGLVRTWDVTAGRPGSWPLEDAEVPLQEGTFPYYSFHLSADGKTLCTAAGPRDRDEVTHFVRWDFASRKPLGRCLLAVKISHPTWVCDDTAFALLRRDGWALIDGDDGQERYRVPTEPGTLTASLGGRTLLAARRIEKAGVVVWEAATGKEVASLPTAGGDLIGFAGGTRLVVTANENAVQAWDLAEGRECWRWPPPGTAGPNLDYKVRVLDGRRVFAALADGSGLILDFAPKVERRVAADEKALTAWWADLAAEDARRAYAAVWKLADAPEAVPFLRKHLRPAAAPDVAAVRKHIANLDHDDFAVREKAQQGLTALGTSIVPEIRRALANKPPLEMLRRLEKVLAAVRGGSGPEERRGLRAVHVLEGASSDVARRILADLAKGAPQAPLTAAAAAALRRAERR